MKIKAVSKKILRVMYCRACNPTGFAFIVLGAIFLTGCIPKSNLTHPSVKENLGKNKHTPTTEELIKMTKKTPQDPRPWYLLGKAYYARREFLLAARSFQQAISLHLSGQELKEAYDKQAWSYYKMGNYNRAIRVFDTANKLYPNWLAPIAGKGCALRQKALYPEAIKKFNEVLARNPYHIMALDNRGWTYYQMKSYKNALNDFQRAETLALRRPLWLSNIFSGQGWCYYMLGHFKKALNRFDKALDTAPPQYHYGLWDANRGKAFAKAALGEFQASYRLIQKASEALQYDASRDMALLHYVAGDKEKAWRYMGGSGYIGVMVKVATLNGRDHIMITSVEEGGPAQEAGLMPGDIIIQIGDLKIKEFTSFHKSIRSANPGSNLSVVVWRDGKERRLTIIVKQAEPLLRDDPLLSPIFRFGSARQPLP